MKNFYRIIIYSVFGAILLSLAATGYFLRAKYYEQMMDSILNNFHAPSLKTETQNLARQLEDKIKEAMNIAKIAVNNPAFQNIGTDCSKEQSEAVERIKIAIGDIADHSALINKEGIVVCSPFLEEMIGKNIGSTPYIQEGLLSKNSILSRIFTNVSGDKTILIITPVISQKGEIIGLLNSAIRVDALEKILTNNFKFTPSEYTTLIDDDGTVIYHPVYSFVMKNVFGDEIQEAIEYNKGTNNMFKKMLLAETGYDFYFFQEDKIAGYAPVRLTDGNRFWSVASTAKVKEYKYVADPFFETYQGSWVTAGMGGGGQYEGNGLTVYDQAAEFLTQRRFFAQRVAELVGDQPDQMIVELAAGTGLVSSVLKAKLTKSKLAFFDLSLSALQELRRRLRGDADASVANFFSLPIASESVDKVLEINA
ncbi:MAG: Methyl-accepting chemotaxis protein, partial [Candidatus Moranbacteria bacterium GW2011_GWF2_37_7]